jgi:hypothetical protein
MITTNDLTDCGVCLIMKKLCEKYGKEFTKYKYVSVLWRREKIPACPHCNVVQESAGFSEKHPCVENSEL